MSPSIILGTQQMLNNAASYTYAVIPKYVRDVLELSVVSLENASISVSCDRKCLLQEDKQCDITCRGRNNKSHHSLATGEQRYQEGLLVCQVVMWHPRHVPNSKMLPYFGITRTRCVLEPQKKAKLESPQRTRGQVILAGFQSSALFLNAEYLPGTLLSFG